MDSRHRPHVNVVNLAEGRGGRVVDGPALDATSISKLLCDWALHRVVMSGRASVLDYGTFTRTIPTPLWNARAASTTAWCPIRLSAAVMSPDGGLGSAPTRSSA